MSIRLILEESNPAVERVLLAVRDVPQYEQINTLELALSWLRLIRRPQPLTFTLPHTHHLAVGDYPEFDLDNSDKPASLHPPEPTYPVTRTQP